MLPVGLPAPWGQLPVALAALAEGEVLGNQREGEIRGKSGCWSSWGAEAPVGQLFQLRNPGSVPHVLMESQVGSGGFLWDLLVAALASEPGLSSE